MWWQGFGGNLQASTVGGGEQMGGHQNCVAAGSKGLHVHVVT